MRRLLRHARHGIIAVLFVAAIPNALADDSAAAQGTAYLSPFKKELMAALKSGLEDGPVAAINACRIEAPAIAARNSADGVRVGRSSHRLRNPDNTPPGWVSPTLDAWLDAESQRKPVVVELGDDRLGYIEPIIAKPLCLTCHGDSLAPAISDAIDMHYPADQATGFEAGDLRGVFWVEFPR